MRVLSAALPTDRASAYGRRLLQGSRYESILSNKSEDEMTTHLPECPVAERRGTVNDSDCTCYQHLPECILPTGYGDCICEELRAYGERVLTTIRRDSWYEDGWKAALDAAREAVLTQHPRCVQPCEMCAEWDDALAAIDALRERVSE